MEKSAAILALALLSCWSTAAFASNVVADAARRWPMRVVDVVICDGGLKDDITRDACRPQKTKRGEVRRSARLREREARLVRATLDRWNAEFGQNISFREVSDPPSPSTIVFRRSSRSSRCSTEGIGYSRSQRWKHISVGSRCGSANGEQQTSQGTIAHEMLHAVGVYHEQQRRDRSKMVRVGSTGSKAHQWSTACVRGVARCKQAATTRPVGRYDFGSVMHYSLQPGRAKPTRLGQRRLEAQGMRTSRVGQRKWLSAADKQGLRQLYPRLL